MLFSDIDSTALANHDDAHLTGILHLFLDLTGDIVSQNRGLGIGDLVRLNHDVDLATSLHGIGTLDAVMGVGNLFELLKALDVVLGRFATSTGARGRNGIGSLDQNIEHRIGVDVGVVSLNSVNDNGLLAIATGELGADNGMRTLDVMVDSLAKIVQQAGALGGHNVQAKLGSHHAAQVGNLEGVLEHVLTKRGAVAQSTKGLNDLGVQIVDTGIHDLHPEIVKTLGALRYRTSFGQNVLQHSLEVSDLCGVMASELGLDVVTAKRAGLLHDLGKAIDHDVEGPHAVIGAELARRYGEKPVIVHAIEAHHADVDPNTVLDVLVQAADAVSASRPGARRESAENYIKRLEKLEEIANSHDGVERTYAMQAGREVHVMVQPDKISDAQSTVLAHDIARQIEEEMEYPGQVRVVVIRESRAVDIAK